MVAGRTHCAVSLVVRAAVGARCRTVWNLWQRLSLGEAAAVVFEHRQQQRPGHGEKLSGAPIGEAIEDMTGSTLGFDQAVSTENGKVLGQMGGFELGLGLQVGDADFCGTGEELEDTDSVGVGQPFEQIGLDLIEGALHVT